MKNAIALLLFHLEPEELFGTTPRRYRARMKRQENPKGSITKPLLQDLMNRKQADHKQNPVVPAVQNSPAKQPMQPALYQDAGSGYNSNLTFPQD